MVLTRYYYWYNNSFRYEEVFCLKIIAISFFRVPIIQGPVTEAIVQLLAQQAEDEVEAAAADSFDDEDAAAAAGEDDGSEVSVSTFIFHYR
jgi:hypothetical protein